MSQYETSNSPADTAKGGRSSARSLSEQSHRVLEDVKELGHTALSAAGEQAEKLRERSSAALAAGREKASAAKHRFDGVVSEHPLKSVLIAMGVGALLGYALRRR